MDSCIEIGGAVRNIGVEFLFCRLFGGENPHVVGGWVGWEIYNLWG